jgi:crotonobetainyl-CoA:carnitine CoA-transferase CaiB-like acyl-CoA transferase
MILAQMGADVIKINSVAEAHGPHPAGEVTWAGSGRGKRSIAIDLKSTDGQEVVRRLIATADVLHQNLRGGVGERIGIDYATARQLNSRIIYCHSSAYGETGPMATWRGSDQMGQALSGLEYEQGATSAGGYPTWYRFGMTDAATGLVSVIGILQALYERERTGEGQRVDTNILNAAALLVSETYLVSGRRAGARRLDSNQTGLCALERLYETAQGWIAIVAHTDEAFNNLLRSLDLSDVADDPRFASVELRTEMDSDLAAVLEGQFVRKTAGEWFALLDGNGVPCEIPPEDLDMGWFDDADAIESGWVVGHPHPVYGWLEQPGDFFSFEDTPCPRPGPLPLMGEHTAEILQELGYSTAEVASLQERGVINRGLTL